MLDHTAMITDGGPKKRLAWIVEYAATQYTISERNCTKPFNPLLGETYELIIDDFEFLSEQVSHHPPVTSSYCRSKKTKYLLYTNQKTNTKFRAYYFDFN